MKRRIICACRIHFNFLLETREAHNHNGSTKHHQPFHQQASHTKKCSKLYTYWISFENLNIWLLLPVWKIEQFSGRTCCEVILSRQKQLRTARATPTKKIYNERGKVSWLLQQNAIFTLTTHLHTFIFGHISSIQTGKNSSSLPHFSTALCFFFLALCIFEPECWLRRKLRQPASFCMENKLQFSFRF